MLRIRLREFDYKAAVGIQIFEKRGDRHYAAAPVQFEMREVKEGDPSPEPFMTISAEYMQQFFQGLCNELARLGYRADNEKVAGLFEAQTTHLHREMVQHDRLFQLLSHTMQQALLPPSERR